MLKSLRFHALIVLTLIFASIPSFSADAANDDSGSTVTRSYSAPLSVLPGMLVGPQEKDTNAVRALTSEKASEMLGIVIPVSDAPISLTNQQSQEQVLVASTGQYKLLVSNQNGPIKSGDYLVVSALGGIAMRAGETQTHVIGRAVNGFSGTGDILGTKELVSDQKTRRSVNIGTIAANIQLAPNPLLKPKTDLSGFLGRVANGIADKPVSPLRVYLSAAILLACFLIAGMMIYSGVNSSVISLGRNPLAKFSIVNSMFKLVVIALLILAIGMLGSYLIINL